MYNGALGYWVGLPEEPIDIVDKIAICAAEIALDAGDNLIVVACNCEFLRLAGALRADPRNCPIPLESLIGDIRSHEIGRALLAWLTSPPVPAADWSLLFEHGGQRWHLSLTPVWSDAGERAHPSKLLLAGVDITTQAAPDADASRYRAVVDLAYDAIVTMDQQHNITLFNRAAENLFGYAASDVLGQPVVMLLPERLRAGHAEKVNRFAESYEPTIRHKTPPRMDDSNSVYGQHRDGSVIPVEVAVSKIERNGAIEFIAVVRDITDRARLFEFLKKQAATDVLTGLSNRREFADFLEKELTADTAISVLILDIDCFKDINDRYGHDAGDEVLRVLAEVGEATLGKAGLFARWGGEEFVAALPGADAKGAYVAAEALRERFERRDFAHVWRLEPIPFTVSIGVVARAPGEVDVDGLMKRADRALYRAKQSGRNRVEVG